MVDQRSCFLLSLKIHKDMSTQCKTIPKYIEPTNKCLNDNLTYIWVMLIKYMGRLAGRSIVIKKELMSIK